MIKKKIAITGGIGSGKSLALRYISQIGYPIFSCDEIYKEVIQSPEYIEKISSIFPDVVVNGLISRELLSKTIFNNEANRKKLNEIAHPLIMNRLHVQMDACKSDLVFAEVPLLFEGNFEKKFDAVIYIYRDKEKRIENVMSRDKLSRTDIEKRMMAQFDPDTEDCRKRLSESGATVIQNNHTPERLFEKLLKAIALMKQ